MGFVFGLGALLTVLGAGNGLRRWRYDRHHETDPNRMAVSRWGFFYPPLRAALGIGALGVLLVVVGGLGSIV